MADPAKLNIQIDPAPTKTRKFSGAGLREISITAEGHSFSKWKRIRWAFLIFVNFLFFASYYLDIQIMEGTLSGSRFLGFHMIDPYAAMQIVFASKLVHVNLIIGVATIVLAYLILGGRFFCSWVCPYHLLAELGEWINEKFIPKALRKNLKFDYSTKYYVYGLFLVVSLVTGYAVFDVINPVSALSRLFVYGPSLILLFVGFLLFFEIFVSKRAWCRYFCPVGVSYNLIGAISPFKIKWDKEKCSNCKKCQQVCMVPFVLTDTTNKGIKEYVTSGECTRCGLCIDVCGDEALKYSFRYLDKII